MRIQASAKRVLLLNFLLLAQGCGPADPTPTGNGTGAAKPGRAVAAPAASRRAAHPVDPTGDEAELIRLEHDYARALMSKDRAFLMRSYAPDWRGGNWMGFWSKSTILNPSSTRAT